MKALNILFSVILLLIISCEKDDNLRLDNQSGFRLEISDSIIFNSNQIDFYDFSSHLIYLKDGHSFSYSKSGFFNVFVDSSLIYKGQMLPMYSSLMPMGPVINCSPTFYDKSIISIGFNQIIGLDGSSNIDPRNDERIINVLKKSGQYRAGLTCNIITIQKLSSNTVKIEIQLTNHDLDNLLYLDPNKMGLGLFHYFTNGLILRDLSYNSYSHKLTKLQPEPWNSWNIEWLSIIKSNETKTISIIYDNFETTPVGQYEANFIFPGLTYQIDKSNLNQDNGRIWLGKIQMKKKIDF